MAETIGFIGLGIMGKPMARHLLRAGYPLVVNNRSQGAVSELVAAGARGASSARAVAEQSDIVITMLPDPATVEQVIGGADGVLEGARAGALVVDMSSSTPRLARQLSELGAARGVAVLDAPVSGGEVGAQNASLSIMVGGTDAGFARALPMLKSLGSNIVHVGPSGSGQVVKAANQVIVALTIEAVAEALVLVARAGGDATRAREVMQGGFASSRILELHGKRMLEHNFVPGGYVRTHHKDLQIALELAQEFGVTLPVTRIVDGMFLELMQNGYGDEDHSALVRVIEEGRTGLRDED